MISVLKLAGQYGQERLRQAIETALATGCTDPAAVRAPAAGRGAEPALRVTRSTSVDAGTLPPTAADDDGV